MAESGYDPVQMARFFQKLASSGGQQLQILSDHPNRGNREVAIQAEMKALPQRQYGYDTGQFARVKKEVAALPAPAKKTQSATVAPGASVPAPGGSSGGSSSDWQSYRGQGFALNYPRGWQAFGEDKAGVTLAPRDGVVSQGGATQIGFGAVIGQVALQSGRSDLRNATAFVVPLAGANTTEVISALQRCAAFLRGLLAREVPLRYAPNLTFALDRSFDEAERINQVLARPEVARDLQPQPVQSEVPGDEG